MIQEIIMLVLEIIPKGIFEKLENGYNFESEEGDYIVTVTFDSIEFKIKTLKWIPGSYEPIEGNELYKRIEYYELEGQTKQHIIGKLSSVINEISS